MRAALPETWEIAPPDWEPPGVPPYADYGPASAQEGGEPDAGVAEAPAATSGGTASAPGDSQAPSAAPAEPASERMTCTHHPDVASVGLCRVCSNPLCAVCSFEIPGAARICPECLLKNEQASPQPVQTVALIIALLMLPLYVPVFVWLQHLLVHLGFSVIGMVAAGFVIERRRTAWYAWIPAAAHTLMTGLVAYELTCALLAG